MKLLIIEDQHLIREMLVSACKRAYPKARIHEAGTAEESLQKFLGLEPDLVLIDIGLPDGDGVILAEKMRQKSDRVRIIVLSSVLDDYTLHRAQFVGINGFVDKSTRTFDTVKEAIAAVMEGRPYACPVVREARARMRGSSQCFSKLLSNREMELLVQISRGKTNEEIGDAFQLSAKTVCNHRQNIMTKLGMNSSLQLLRYAAEKGFAHAPDGALPLRSSAHPAASL